MGSHMQFKKRSCNCKRKMNGVILTFAILTVAVFSSPIDQPLSRWKRQLFGTGVAGGRPLTGSSSVVGITNRANNLLPRQYGLPYRKPDCGFTYQQRYLNRDGGLSDSRTVTLNVIVAPM